MKELQLRTPMTYHLQVSLKQLLAQQNSDLDKRVDTQKLGYEKEQSYVYKQGTTEEEHAEEKTKHPTVKRNSSKKRSDVTSTLCHCFERKDGHIIAQLGGTFGALKTTLRKAKDAIGLAKYKIPSTELLTFSPDVVDLGEDKDIKLTPVLEPRSRGQTRELVLYETVTDRKFNIDMNVSATCPLTGEEISALLTAIKDYDGFGPSKRGRISSIEVA